MNRTRRHSAAPGRPRPSPRWCTRVSRVAAAVIVMLAATPAGTQPLVDFQHPKARPALAESDARARYVTRSGRTVLRVETGHTGPWPGVTLKAGESPWNLASAGYLRADIRNAGTRTLTVNCRVDNPGADGRKHCTTASLRLAAGEAGALLVPLTRPVFERGPIRLFGMRGSPIHEPVIDLTNVTQVIFFLHRPREKHAFEIHAVSGCGAANPFHPPEDPDRFFPLVDRFGQYAHGDWPGKTKSGDDLREDVKAESRDLAAHPPPKSFNRYGGWAVGPELKATGHFRVEKRDGMWWLVDPEGRLFWSHGVDCVHEHAATPVTDREAWYAELPAPDTPLARFFGRADWAPHGYYRDHRPFRTYDFFRANLVRKYGRAWNERFRLRTLERLGSWGLNTIGNWSSHAVCLERKVPYVRGVHVKAVELEGSKGYWGKFPDVFDPRFAQAAKASFHALYEQIGDDPWCIGFFVDNELTWGKVEDLPTAVLRSPPGQAARKALASWLEEKHGTIDRLNRIWQTKYAGWEELRTGGKPPAGETARRDLNGFSLHMARHYFRTVREALKSEFPHHLYLGCRFSVTHDVAAQAAAETCDVVSYNLYSYDVEAFRLPGTLDRPVLVGEFHFGALDRGLFHTGLRAAGTQTHRAALYESYVRGALRNPWIVGTHWFQYKDQALTGRGDGENYQIGFVDGCDRPYPELVAAARAIGARLYDVRSGEKTGKSAAGTRARDL